MEIGGLPLHPLVVHAAVVLGPLGALTSLAYCVIPRWRDLLRWPMLVMVLVAVGSIGAAYLSGRSFLESRPELNRNSLVGTHQDRAELLMRVALGYGAVALATGWWHDRPGWVRPLLLVALALASGAVLVGVVLTGDAGSRAVWGEPA